MFMKKNIKRKTYKLIGWKKLYSPTGNVNMLEAEAKEANEKLFCFSVEINDDS